jgi:hypothetical protein
MRLDGALRGVVAALVWGFATAAEAQVVVRNEIVVPQQNVFTIGTTISVPDRGGAVVGGFHSGSRTSTRGLGRGVGVAGHTAAGAAGAQVWIHDFDQLERPPALAAGADGSSSFRRGLHRYAADPIRVRESGAEQPEQNRGLDAAARDAQAADLLRRGLDAEARGKPKIALIYFRSAASINSAPSALSARERLMALELKLAGR